MSDASGVDLEQFKRWYSQAGTPVLRVAGDWDEVKKLYTLSITQSCAPTPGQEVKKPFHIPMRIGLLDSQGRDMIAPDTLLELRQEQQAFTFSGLEARPVLSFLRSFSAPVRVEPFQGREELAFLMAHDSDLFNRWDAANRLGESIIFECVKTLQAGGSPAIDPLFVEALRLNLSEINDGGKQSESSSRRAFLAQILTLPSENTLALNMEVIDPDNLFLARRFVRTELARQLAKEFRQCYAINQEDNAIVARQSPLAYALTPEAMGRRSLKNTCLSCLMAMEPLPAEHLELAVQQYRRKANMTDVMAALGCLVHCTEEQARQEALADFYRQWQYEPLVVDKWLTLQATSSLENTLETVRELLTHPAFSLTNPNKVRALIGAFGTGNHVRFHAATGAGYQFLADQIIRLDPVNPHIAARLMSPFTSWKRYDSLRQGLMREQMERIADQNNLSAGVTEVVRKSLS
jgi:aminopeptidase N